MREKKGKDKDALDAKHPKPDDTRYIIFSRTNLSKANLSKLHNDKVLHKE